jgi:NAD(P)-dependent dehydrogenase (short-subunit alcohol dehydrogenase family)
MVNLAKEPYGGYKESSIGREFSLEEGARVFITGRHQSQLDQAVASIGDGAAAIQADSSNLGDLDRVFATIRDQAGRVDVLAVSAGVYEFGTLEACRT